MKKSGGGEDAPTVTDDDFDFIAATVTVDDHISWQQDEESMDLVSNNIQPQTNNIQTISHPVQFTNTVEMTQGLKVHGGIDETSDAREKSNIEPLTPTMVSQYLMVQAVSFTYKSDAHQHKTCGILAQDVRNYPELQHLVHESSSNGILSVNTSAFHGLNLAAIQRLDLRLQSWEPILHELVWQVFQQHVMLDEEEIEGGGTPIICRRSLSDMARDTWQALGETGEAQQKFITSIYHNVRPTSLVEQWKTEALLGSRTGNKKPGGIFLSRYKTWKISGGQGNNIHHVTPRSAEPELVQLRPEQAKLVEKLTTHELRPTLLVAPTNFGKTEVAIETYRVLCNLTHAASLCVFVVRDNVLAIQQAQRFEQRLGRRFCVGCLNGGVLTVNGHMPTKLTSVFEQELDVLVGTSGSLSNAVKDYQEIATVLDDDRFAWAKRVNMVAFDEAHNAIGNSPHTQFLQHVMDAVCECEELQRNPPLVLGMTATAATKSTLEETWRAVDMLLSKFGRESRLLLPDCDDEGKRAVEPAITAECVEVDASNDEWPAVQALKFRLEQYGNKESHDDTHKQFFDELVQLVQATPDDVDKAALRNGLLEIMARGLARRMTLQTMDEWIRDVLVELTMNVQATTTIPKMARVITLLHGERERVVKRQGVVKAIVRVERRVEARFVYQALEKAGFRACMLLGLGSGKYDASFP